MKQMTEKHRYYIEVELRRGASVAEIAEALGFNRVSIYKEIARGTCEQMNSDLTKKLVYLADYAQHRHDENVSRRGRKRKLEKDDAYLEQIAGKIADEKYSPEAAVYTVPGKKVCVKTIYNYIHAGHLEGVGINQLPYAKKKKKKTSRVGKRVNRGKSIEERPQEANERKVYGHWEMDTVYSSKDDKTCLLVLTERKTRSEKLFKIPDRTAGSVVRCLNKLERKMGCRTFRETFKTITCDNGMEFSNWEEIERSVRNKTPRTSVYFCHPYCSGERGSNENQNKMVRRWIPKGDDIGLYTDAEIQQIENWINAYPRKLFDWKSSSEMVC